MLQYLFTVPNFMLLANITSQKRDMLFIICTSILSVCYGLIAFARAVLEDAHRETPQKETEEYQGACNMTRVSLLMLALVLTMSAYDNAGYFYLRASHVTTFAHSFQVMFLLYLLLGMICPHDIKRICFMDWCIRFVVTLFMLVELTHK